MRCDQYIGLNERGQKLVEGNLVVVQRKTIDTYPDGNVKEFEEVVEISDITIEATDNLAEGFGRFPLHKYTLVDGTEYTEFVQVEPWSSGPMFFIALKGKDGTPVKDSLWTEKELKEYGV